MPSTILLVERPNVRKGVSSMSSQAFACSTSRRSSKKAVARSTRTNKDLVLAELRSVEFRAQN